MREEARGDHAKIFLNQILPEAPGVVVQIAHLAGGGRSTGAALAVYADAIAAGDARTRNLYFDAATLTGGQSDEGDSRGRRAHAADRPRTHPLGKRRRVGAAALAGVPRRYATHEEEFRTIASNRVPYLR